MDIDSLLAILNPSASIVIDGKEVSLFDHAELKDTSECINLVLKHQGAATTATDTQATKLRTFIMRKKGGG